MFNMETRDFNDLYLKVIFIKIINYDTILLNIYYPDHVEIKECTLFRVSSNKNIIHSEIIINCLNSYLKENSEYQIKILKERRKALIENSKELIMLYNVDLKNNINDTILKCIDVNIENNKLNLIFEKIRLQKKD